MLSSFYLKIIIFKVDIQSRLGSYSKKKVFQKWGRYGKSLAPWDIVF